MSKNTPSKIEQALITEIKTLTKDTRTLSKEVSNLKNLEFIQVFKHPLKFMWFSFLKGLMVGFGSVLGASVLVAVFLYVIGKISFVPVVGEFVQEIINEIQHGQPLNNENKSESNFDKNSVKNVQATEE